MSVLTSWLASPPPDAALEIAADAVSAVTLGYRGAEAVVEAFAYEPLPSGALTPSLSGQNVGNQATVVSAVQAVIERLTSRPKRVALVIPDSAARVSLIRFDQVPAAKADLDQLVRWNLKKSAPFPVEDACVTYARGITPSEGGHEFARREAEREYEGVCEKAGLHAGIVDLSTFSLINSFLSGGSVPSGDWLLVHLRSDYTSIVIMRGNAVIFFRNKPEGDGDRFADLVHQTTMYYQDRLEGQGFARVLVGGTGRTGSDRAGSDVEIARRDLQERLGTSVEPIDPARLAVLPERLGTAPEHLGRVAPLVGMLLRTRQEVEAA
jgi:type IV pilus assembly protein PilM